jgi:hypothetical protein
MNDRVADIEEALKRRDADKLNRDAGLGAVALPCLGIAWFHPLLGLLAFAGALMAVGTAGSPEAPARPQIYGLPAKAPRRLPPRGTGGRFIKTPSI